MKNKILFVVFILGCWNMISAQSNYNNYNDPSDDPESDFSIFATLGTRPLGISGDDIYFSYLDESPSMDFLQSDIILDPSLTSFGLKIGFQGMLENGVTIRVAGDFNGGQVKASSIDFGAGYTIGRKKFHVRPALMLSYGTHRINLGSLPQNDVFIQVNDQRFYSEYVYISLRARHFVFSPQLELGYEINDQFEILVSGGYNFGTTSRPFIKFKGYDEEDVSVSERERTNIPNATLRYGDQKITDSPVDVNGMFIHAGIGIRFPE